ncbi:MAG: hypothetical protein HGB35_08390 [Geobacteraceae bacterium]|nr:hypothetical protein [Geobacteraceae bacterium]
MTITFDNRAVAFVDVLGFKALVNSAVGNNDLASLAELVSLLSAAIPSFDATVVKTVPKSLIPLHIYISDCIILSAPMYHPSYQYYNGLSIVVMRIIQLSHLLLRAGYLIRGGISVGNVWHSESNIVGPAYQEAFALEQGGQEPIVNLSPSAAKCWEGKSRMCLLKDGKVFVNGLFDYYIPNSTEHGVIERTYKQYAALAEQRLCEGLPPSAKEKWQWFKDFVQAEASEGLKYSPA